MKKEEKKILYTEPSSYFTKETLEKVFGIVDEEYVTNCGGIPAPELVKPIESTEEKN